MNVAPIGRYMTDLAILLVKHPAPWRMAPIATGECILDARNHVAPVAPLTPEIGAGLVAAVNLAAGLRP